MEFRRLTPKDKNDFRELMALFGEAFNEVETYIEKNPNDAYVSKILEKDHIIHLVAKESGKIVGGLVAYVLEKFEQERAEVYIYDLAVAPEKRRRGIATGLIKELRLISKGLGAWVLFVQADYVDSPAIKLYESLGQREEVLHFDIEV